MPSKVDWVKYPRTMHLPWSPGLTKDDRVIDNLKAFEGRRVVVTIKMDGENTTLYKDGLHARSLDYQPHPSRNYLKILHAKMGHDIPKQWRICGENLYAEHSIHYKGLENYFLVFSIWDSTNTCLDWKETKEWAKLLGLHTVPTVYEGVWDEGLIKSLYSREYSGNECEGYVVRVEDIIPFEDFQRCVAKYVRRDHVQTHQHWRHKQLVANELRES